MAKIIVELDELNKRVYFDVDAGSETVRTIKELGSMIKQELQKAPHIDQDAIFTWSGDEEYITNNRTGVVMIMQDSWTLWTRDQGAKHRFRITQGLVLDSASGDPLGTPTNVVWSLAEQSVSSISGLGTVEGKIDIIDTNVDTINTNVSALQTDLATVDGNVDLVNALIGNDQEWVSPGLLKIYDAGGKVGGTTIAEFETRTSAGVQTFVLADVKQYIRTK